MFEYLCGEELDIEDEDGEPDEGNVGEVAEFYSEENLEAH